ncbi:Crp/Fnr family transcriptional regulator [Anaerobacillus alkalidiazotrophicus]|uniref:Crp/Fnr family transcriptional regulator n=1 Tax=Anaerobacillus alkalidiazotrophicus TaxID=472963 RepID=A0A1S2M5J0_9BACI|nr:Crp/Fnr family transcriptional regulator [Anaerobacillus alkalidiazotrophicus]OIJ18415.1 Crp/Fnr family transcriptional regulator [Anaerobacillus alkalidiazotrophicus]OIJ19894.1 Crp/Fnr family transcriptional regulator [Anaerobacillus alkalidiazotrophicus]
MVKITKETFFDELSEEEKQYLLSQGTEISVQKGNSLFFEGDRPKHIYFIKSGRVRLSKTSVEGKVLFFQLKQDNDFIGELSLYNNLKLTSNADVIKDSILVRFEREVIEDICRVNGAIALAFMRRISIHSNSLLAQFRDLIFCGKKGALFSILIRLSNAHGTPCENGILINKKLTSQELANYIGATRESISRILKNLTNEEIISINSKYITIKNIEYLQEHLRCESCPYVECTI